MKPRTHLQELFSARTSLPRVSRPYRTGAWILLLMVALVGPTHAGGKPNGRDLQGLKHSPAVASTPRALAGWSNDDRLIGWFVDVNGEPKTLLEIASFQGDTVHGLAHDLRTMEPRAVQFRPDQLVGMHWESTICTSGAHCASALYRIASAAPDDSSSTMPRHSSNRDTWLYEVQISTRADETSDDWTNICPLHSERGLFVTGRWRSDGSWNASGYTFSCPSGVIAKCVRDWGYKPWKEFSTAVQERVHLRPLHLACVRAVRADYCGDGVSHTIDGTMIDIADRYGFNQHEHLVGFEDESAFGQYGALWVRTPRWLTGRRVTDGWRFATCSRPDAKHPPASEEPLLYVQSQAASV